MKLLVDSDFEHKCFNINFDLVQSIFEQIKNILGDENVKTAKDLLEWIGILGGPLGLSGLSLLAYLRWRKGRKVASATQISETTKGGMVALKVEGEDNHVEVHNHVYKLGNNIRVLNAVAGVVGPLGQNGIETLEFRQNDEPTSAISKAEAAEIVQSCVEPAAAEIEHPPQEIIAHLRVLRPVYEESAENWGFYYGLDKITADISDTNIAAETLARGGAFVGDVYKVRLQITEHQTPTQQFRNSYKVLEVLGYFPAARQLDLLPSPGATHEAQSKASPRASKPKRKSPTRNRGRRRGR